MGGYRQSWERVPQGPKPEGPPVYTPTTEEVREAYSWLDNYPYEGFVHPEREAAFLRWLASVRADAWDEGWAALSEQERLQRADRFHPITRGNPYRSEKRDTLS